MLMNFECGKKWLLRHNGGGGGGGGGGGRGIRELIRIKFAYLN
jgi:hypothetical protein